MWGSCRTVCNLQVFFFQTSLCSNPHLPHRRTMFGAVSFLSRGAERRQSSTPWNTVRTPLRGLDKTSLELDTENLKCENWGRGAKQNTFVSSVVLRRSLRGKSESTSVSTGKKKRAFHWNFPVWGNAVPGRRVIVLLALKAEVYSEDSGSAKVRFFCCFRWFYWCSLRIDQSAEEKLFWVWSRPQGRYKCKLQCCCASRKIWWSV